MALEGRDRVRGKRLVVAALSAVLLASCTSSSVLQLGLTPEELAASGTGSGPGGSAFMTAALPGEEEPNALPLPTSRPAADSAQSRAAAGAKSPSPGSDEPTAATGEENPTKKEAAGEETEPDEGKRSFLSAFFSPSRSGGNAASRALAETAGAAGRTGAAKQAEGPAAEASDAATPQEEPRETEPVEVASSTPADAALYEMDSLPGVRPDESLFEISSASSMEDIDVYENTGSYQLASAAGMARLAPNGLLKRHESVETGCFKPRLVRLLKTIEGHYNRRVIVTSGYRSPEHNRRVNGAPRSLHMSCAAADIVVDGVSKWELASFVRALPGRGGVGTYCHTGAIHVDVGPQRDWNWRCRRRN